MARQKNSFFLAIALAFHYLCRCVAAVPAWPQGRGGRQPRTRKPCAAGPLTEPREALEAGAGLLNIVNNKH